MTFFESMRAVTVRLLARFGQPAVITRVVQTYDPRSGKSAETSTSTATRCAKPRTRTKAVDGTFVRETTAVLLTPVAIGDEITIAGQAFTIVAVDRTDDETGLPVSIKITLA